jgi:hypothetical protein
MDTRSEKLTAGLFSFGVYIFGLICGILALTKIPRFGNRGILAPAIVGVVINGLLVAAFTLAILVGFSIRK